jgi:hypothetical protein
MTARISSRASTGLSQSGGQDVGGDAVDLGVELQRVTNSAVPATLKSMSPKASSAPRMSVRVVYFPSAKTRPMAMPATGALIGTPASISDSDDEHTDAIEVEPFDDSTSDTRRRA